jgi:hypothetical protein
MSLGGCSTRMPFAGGAAVSGESARLTAWR